MKIHNSFKFSGKAALILVCSIAALLAARSASAASGNWTGGGANANWSTTGNWSATPVPGATSGTTSADVATFNAAIANTWGNAAGNPIVIDSGRNILSISFATSPGNYFIGSTGGNALLLSSGGSIGNGVVNAVETINCPIVLEPASSTTAGSYIFTSTATTGTGYLNFGGNISGGTTTAGIVLNWNGQNANANTISGVISDGGAAGGVSLFKSSAAAGTLYLTGANTYSGTTTINRGTINVGVAENPGVSGPLGKSTAAGSIIFPGSASAGGTGVLQYSAANQYDYSSRFSTATNQYYSVDTAGQTVTWASALTSTNATTLTKSGGAGTLILLGTNTYDGLTTIGGASGSILVISNSSALGSTAAGTVISQGAALRLEGNIAVGPESLSVAGTGFGSGSLYNLSGNNSYGGVITLTGSAGVLFVSASGSLTLTNTAIITSASAQTMSLAGNGTLTMNGGIGTGITVTRTTGTGTTILAGTNLYTAATTISANAGTLQFATPYALYSNTPASWTAANLIVNSGSTLAVNVGGPNDFTTTQVGTLLGNLTTSINNNGLEAGANFGLDTTYATAPVTYSSAIGNSTGTGSGSLGIVKLGAGTLSLASANTYTGGTSLNGGILDLANVSALGPNGSTLYINAAATNQLSTDTAFGGANPVYNVTLWNTGSYIGTMMLNRATAGATTGMTNNFGLLTISLNGNAASGLNVLAGAKAPTGGAVDTLAFTGLSYGNWYSVTETIAPTNANVFIAGTVTPVVSQVTGNQVATLALDGTSTGNQITGNISDNTNSTSINYTNQAAILKNNSSTWTLSGSNTFTGPVNVNGGTLRLVANAANTSGGVSKALNGSSYTTLSLAPGTTLQLRSDSDVTFGGGNGTLGLGGGTQTFDVNQVTSGNNNHTLSFAPSGFSAFNEVLNVTGGNGYTLSVGSINGDASSLTLNPTTAILSVGALSSITALTMNGTNTLTVTGTNTYTGSTTISAGTMTIGGAGQLGSGSYAGNITNNSSLIFNSSAAQTLSGVVSGTGTLTQQGSGSLALSSANTYSGATTISAGVVYPGNNACFGFGPVFLNGGLMYPGGTFSITNSLTLGGGNLEVGGGSSHLFTWSGPITLSANAGMHADGSTAGITLSGSLTNAGFTLTSQADGGTTGNTISGSISGTSGLTYVTGGTLNLNAANTFGGTNRANGGTLSIGNANALQNAFLDMNAADAGTVNLNNYNATIGALTGSRNLALGSGNVSIGNNNVSALYSGALSGGSLTKIGTGTLTLSGANIHTGNTTISAGTLALSGSGSIANTPLISVANGAVFDVSALSSTFVLGSSQTLSNSASTTGTIKGNLNTGSGKNSVSYTSGTPSFTVTNGTLTLSSSTKFNINNTGSALAVGNYKIISIQANGFVAGTVPSSVTVAGSGLASGATASLVISNSELYVAVSMPTTTTLATSGSPSVYGQSVTFTATIAPAGGTVPTGMVQFKTNGVALGSPVTVTTGTSPNGTAAYSINNLPASGSAYSVTAEFTGTGSFLNSTNSPALSQTVNALPVGLTGTRAYDGTTNADYGILTITNIVGSDDVTLTSGSVGLAGANVGANAITSSALTLGGTSAANYTLANLTGSVVITNAVTAIMLISSSQTNGYLDSGLFFTATNLPMFAVGNVIFLTTNGAFSTNAISNGGTVSLVITNLPRGNNLITAEYAGDANVLGSTNYLIQTVTNHPPVAGVMTVTRTAGLSLLIRLSDIATNWSDADGDPVTLPVASFNLVTTNGVNLIFSLDVTNDGTNFIFTTNSFVLYTNSPNVNDQFSYGISDGEGGTNIGYVNIVVASSVTGTNSIVSIVTGNPTTLTAYGIPGYSYITERATNLAPAIWVDISTNTAATNGVISVSDNFGDLGGTPPASAFYQLKWQP